MKLILLCLAHAVAETLVEQASNPHITETNTCGDNAFADLLERPYLLPLQTQGDTLQGVTSARTPGGARVTLYDFKQPKRLSRTKVMESRESDPLLQRDDDLECADGV